MGRHVCFWLLDTCRCIFHNVLFVQVLLYFSVYAYTNEYEIYTGLFPDWKGARSRSVIEHLCIVQWVNKSISHGRPIQLFLIPTNTIQLGMVRIK